MGNVTLRYLQTLQGNAEVTQSSEDNSLENKCFVNKISKSVMRYLTF